MIKDPDLDWILQATTWTLADFQHRPVEQLMRVLDIRDASINERVRRYRARRRVREGGDL